MFEIPLEGSPPRPSTTPLIIDELGDLPIDGADMLFEIISRRYERAPMVIATNRVTCAAAHRPERTSVFTDAASGGID